jgi:hypothetical protein
MTTEIKFFLFLKKKQEAILNNLTEIMNIYFDILKENEMCEIEDNDEYIRLQNECKDKIDYTNNYIHAIDYKLYSTCEHEFVEDYIDITPDTSQKITYCCICEFTKE